MKKRPHGDFLAEIWRLQSLMRGDIRVVRSVTGPLRTVDLHGAIGHPFFLPVALPISSFVYFYLGPLREHIWASTSDAQGLHFCIQCSL